MKTELFLYLQWEKKLSEGGVLKGVKTQNDITVKLNYCFLIFFFFIILTEVLIYQYHV